ncbi:hypothetical protein HHK36_028653 [Tetracentron sinense]|uniref:Remorin C-terminal domain-containing protein n=1 Tax=Tetracentron sinense TaxID=13715 RepID=A0A834YBG1_TETSI|nr:hypothetical protein HHK36_028653 [Tetracentron sinense]
MSNDDKISTSSIEIDKEIENVTYPCSLYQLNLKSNVPRDCEAMEQEYSPKWLSSSPIYESDDAGIDYAIPSMPLLVVIEEEDDEKSQVESGDSRYEDSDTGSPIHGHHRLMNRPKPYHAFLGEIRRKELETEVNAWKEAKHLKLMNESLLRRKEAAINAWEFKQTRKALNDMKKLENKLETKRVNAIEKSQKKIRLTQRKADKKKVDEIMVVFTPKVELGYWSLLLFLFLVICHALPAL